LAGLDAALMADDDARERILWAFSWKHYVLGDNMIAGTLQIIVAMLLFAIIGGTVSWLSDH
jgi:hypothetical protein